MAVELWVSLSRDGDRFAAIAASAGVGEGRNVFDLNLEDARLNQMFCDFGWPRRVPRGAQPPNLVAPRAFGSELFDTVFSGAVRRIFDQARGYANARNDTLRIRLKFDDVPELLDLPWELLHEEHGFGYLALDRNVALLRHLPIGKRIEPLATPSPLCILAVISTPKDKTELPSVEEEWSQLQVSLADLRSDRTVVLERMPNGTLSALKRSLRNRYRMFSLIGHGQFGGENGGELLLQNEAGNAVAISADQLANVLHDCGSLRLVVINACEGARTSRVDPFAGVAQALLSRGIPAVVAMQFPISDEAAAAFAASFYRAIANAAPVDVAVAQSRRELSIANEDADHEWATPVLYVRGDTRLFVARGEVEDQGSNGKWGKWLKNWRVVIGGVATTGLVATLPMLFHAEIFSVCTQVGLCGSNNAMSALAQLSFGQSRTHVEQPTLLGPPKFKDEDLVPDELLIDEVDLGDDMYKAVQSGKYQDANSYIIAKYDFATYAVVQLVISYASKEKQNLSAILLTSDSEAIECEDSDVTKLKNLQEILQRAKRLCLGSATFGDFFPETGGSPKYPMGLKEYPATCWVWCKHRWCFWAWFVCQGELSLGTSSALCTALELPGFTEPCRSRSGQ